MLQSRARCQLASALLGALFLLPETAFAERKAGIVVVTAETARIMRGTTVLGVVKQGTRFRMSEVNGEWYRIHFQRNGKDESGWIHKRDVRIEQAQEKAAPRLTTVQMKRLSEKNVFELYSKFSELHQAGQVHEATVVSRQILAINQQVLGEQHPITAACFRNLGLLLKSTGDYSEARPNLEQALAIYRNVHGDQHRDTAQALNNLGLLSSDMGDYATARSYLEQALVITKKMLGNQHSQTATALDNLGILLQATGDYVAARTYHEQALTIRKKVFGDEHAGTAPSLNNLGMLLSATGDYVTARDYLEQALEIYRKSPGELDAQTATVLNNLGVLLGDMGDNAAARPYLEQALEFYRKVLGEQHPGTATTLNNLGLLLRDTGDYAVARTYFEQSLVICRKGYGEQHANTANALNNLGLLLSDLNDSAAARRYYEQALAVKNNVLGEQHPDTALTLNNLARLLLKAGDSAGAAVRLDEARHSIRRHVARVLPGLSQAEQLTFLTNTDEANFHAALSLGQLNRGDPAIAALSAGWLLNGKAVAHEALAQRALLARESNNPAAAAVLRELETVRSQLARQSLKAVTPKRQAAHRKQLTELEAAADRLTRRLGQLGIDAALPNPWVELDDVRVRIPTAAVLIDIARFRPIEFKNGKRQPARYAAWIIPAAGAGEIRIVDLGEADAVEAAVRTARTFLEQAPELIRTKGEPEAEQALRQPLEELSTLVLQPLLAEVGEAKQLILSPDALLWLVPWSALPIGNEKYAVEDYELSFVVSGRDLVTQRKPLQLQPPLLLADPAFGPAQQNADATQRNGTSLANLPFVPQLPGTAAEARAIQPQIETYTGQAPTLKTGDDATEAAFRTTRRPQVLTLSTHGFFLPDQEVKQTDERLALSSETRSVAFTTDGKPLENPLLRCGLLLAGCNSRSTAAANADDGVLTGLEIVGTDLRGTQLVVLSACETGLGDVRNGEGVAGLRQAFQLAGAESIVATLWQVPDSDTARLMVDFFGQLADGKSRSKALRNAQLARIKAHRKLYGAAHPFFWAAVTLTGEWK